MNSFRFIERGIEAEIARQTALVEAGEAVVQETLHFDPQSGAITSLRSKEEAHDYRYFPEPDLVPVAIDRGDDRGGPGRRCPSCPPTARSATAASCRPQRRERPRARLPPELGAYFEAALASADGARGPGGWRTGSPRARRPARRRRPGRIEGRARRAGARSSALVAEKQVTARRGRPGARPLVAEGGDPEAIVEAEGLGAMGGGDELARVVQAAIEANPDAADQVRARQQKAIGPDHRPRHARDQGPRRRRRGSAADPRAPRVTGKKRSASGVTEGDVLISTRGARMLRSGYAADVPRRPRHWRGRARQRRQRPTTRPPPRRPATPAAPTTGSQAKTTAAARTAGARSHSARASSRSPRRTPRRRPARSRSTSRTTARSSTISTSRATALAEKKAADLQPGSSAKLTVDLKPGKYEMYCSIDGHRAGTEGTITDS